MKKKLRTIGTILFITILILLLTIPMSFAVKEVKGHMKLLAVSEGKNAKGSLADLYLEIRPGKGNVYIDTFPLTKMDTQLSTRFAKEIACKFLETDCKKYDFFYTINAGSSIIGGPSAGAALAMLTVALLDPEVKEYDETVSITGTINTGGIIGSVGGVKEKIDAAAQNGITKVLVPLGSNIKHQEENITLTDEEIEKIVEESNVTVINEDIIVEILNKTQSIMGNASSSSSINQTNSTNQSNSSEFSIENYGKEKNIQVIEVVTLEQALKEFTGKDYGEKKEDILIDNFYTNTMKKISDDICGRTIELKSKLDKDVANLDQNTGNFNHEVGGYESESLFKDLVHESLYNQTLDLINNSEQAVEKIEYYAAASYCFGANINLDYLILLSANFTKNHKIKKMNEIVEAINNSNDILDETNLTSITDLQTYLIVKERLIEAYDTWEATNDELVKNNTDIEYGIAYTTERLYSAYAWSHFFNQSSTTHVLDEKLLTQSCQIILSEAQARLDYFGIIFPYPLGLLEKTKKELNRAYQHLDNNQSKMCIMHAVMAKAEIDAVLSTSNIMKDEELKHLLDTKLELAKQVILKQQSKGLFPILGYSYYEYATSLGQEDTISGLIYSQYALEFSNLDLYIQIKEEKTYFEKVWAVTKQYVYFNQDLFFGFLIGLGSGVGLTIVIYFIFRSGRGEPKQNSKKVSKKSSNLVKKSSKKARKNR
ncbi:hypothetical protein HN695_00475 [Candidatus Woesearchaeota archaeon]|jgi:uncharacterized protein|nr:hypothetical protein [Candidatus Woesearchaeota archaeon]MBT5271810.1 hypothetical protein [Candidatus Woesearchaeota archaeon]MBT6040671.1 hypothetical protein [Candidatus Woesearchaeota archaeon]MBT6336432.1 hypothetical protein [Candidatus Woesearchaeota archaeon]MBT7926788.1 hypothetical protein [Candidatus Woesearchaeota archaeon]